MADDNAMMTDNDPDAPGGDTFATGPLSMLYKAVRNNTQVLINVRNNHKILARVKVRPHVIQYIFLIPFLLKAFDRHCNL